MRLLYEKCASIIISFFYHVIFAIIIVILIIARERKKVEKMRIKKFFSRVTSRGILFASSAAYRCKFHSDKWYYSGRGKGLWALVSITLGNTSGLNRNIIDPSDARVVWHDSIRMYACMTEQLFFFSS